MATEEEKRHTRLSNMKGIVPSLSGIHYKVHNPKAKSKALHKAKDFHRVNEGGHYYKFSGSTKEEAQEKAKSYFKK